MSASTPSFLLSPEPTSQPTRKSSRTERCPSAKRLPSQQQHSEHDQHSVRFERNGHCYSSLDDKRHPDRHSQLLRQRHPLGSGTVSNGVATYSSTTLPVGQTSSPPSTVATSISLRVPPWDHRARPRSSSHHSTSPSNSPAKAQLREPTAPHASSPSISCQSGDLSWRGSACGEPHRSNIGNLYLLSVEHR